MISLRRTVFGLGLAVLFAACSGEEASPPNNSNGCTADTANDPQNCGACGVACVVGQACAGGVCTVSCSPPQTNCGGLCADTASNALHCGACNQPCGADQICTNSACVTGSCPTGTTLCSGACVDTLTDLSNCGTCGGACLVGQSCQAGVCTGGGGGTGGSGGSGGTAGAGPTGGSAGGGAMGGSGGAGPTGGSAGASAGMAGAAGSTPVNLPPLVTSAQNAYWNTSGMVTEVSAGTPTVTVNDSAVAQTWEGFGGSFNERGWSYLTTPEMRTRALTLLFSATDGANLIWGRIPMGASDYATTRYSLADTGMDVVPNGDQSNRPPADTALNSFSLARDGELLIPYIKAAQAIKPDIRFWASPWTPPVWMKTGFKSNSGVNSSQPATRPSYFDGGNMRNDAAILGAFAQYFVRFVEGYRAQGINVEVVAPQNEPNYDQNYPSCIWDGATFATFVAQHLGPAMMGLNVRIMLGTLSNPNSDPAIGSTTLANATARGFLSVIGVQWGMLDPARLSALNSNLPVWATEHKCGNYPWNPAGSPAYNNNQAPNDHAYGIESWGLLRDAIKSSRVTMYSAWNMVLDRLGLGNDTTRDWKQNALLVADGGNVNPTPTYYVFRHFSQYVMPGATVVGVNGGDAVAFKNPDGSLVAVMFNSGGANNNYIVSMGGKNLQFAMPANGWATVKVTP